MAVLRVADCRRSAGGGQCLGQDWPRSAGENCYHSVLFALGPHVTDNADSRTRYFSRCDVFEFTHGGGFDHDDQLSRSAFVPAIRGRNRRGPRPGHERRPRTVGRCRGRTASLCSRFRWPSGRCIACLFAGKLDNLDFPRFAKSDFGIDCVEYVNQFFMDKAQDTAYLTDLKQRCDDNGVNSGLIMCDGEGDLGDPDEAKRTPGGREPLQMGRGGQVPRLPLDPRQRPLGADSVRRADGPRRRRPAAARRVRQPARHQRDRREPRRAVVQRQVARRRHRRRSICRTAARCPTSATSSSAPASGTTAIRASAS